MTKRAAGKSGSRIVGEWFAVALSCPRCAGPTEARTSSPRQVGLPWAEETPTLTEWRCRRPLGECTGPTLDEVQAARGRLVPDRARALAPTSVAGETYTCTTCGAVWGRALLRCPVDQGAIVPTAALRRSA